MKRLSALNWITLIAGEAILIACFFLLANGLARDIFWLDLVVASIVYCLLFFRTLRPMVDLADKTGSDVGALGLSWGSVLIYSIAAICLMVVMQLYDVEFKYQIMTQVILAFFLFLTRIAVSGIREKTREVYHAEKRMTGGLDAVRREARSLERMAETVSGIPAQTRGRVTEVCSRLRYLSPSDNPEASELEEMLCVEIGRIRSMCQDHEVNADMIDSSFRTVSRLIDERKSIYSR